MQDEQPVSLQDELDEANTSTSKPETSNFRQIFAKMFSLLQTTHADNDVTWLNVFTNFYAMMGPTSTTVDWFYATRK